jgi:predicted nucleic acid-binding protein
MKDLAALIDSDVLVDYLIDRDPFAVNAHKILALCSEKEISGYCSGLSIPNIFYILRKQHSSTERRSMLLNLCEVLEIAGISKAELIDALSNEDFHDFEDCLQMQSAKAVNADYIITRNIKDYSASSIPAILPEDFLKIVK